MIASLLPLPYAITAAVLFVAVAFRIIFYKPEE